MTTYQNTWMDYLRVKWEEGFKKIPEDAQRMNSVFPGGPMDVPTYQEYCETFGKENADMINHIRCMTLVGHYAWFFFKHLRHWDKEAWYRNYQESLVWNDDLEEIY